MKRCSKKLFWFFCVCFLTSCAHSGDSSTKASKDVTPTAPAAVSSAPAPALAPAGAALAQNAVAGPVLVAPVTSHDFGQLNDETDYVHDFKIKNAGKAVLEIKKVLPG